MPQSPCGPAGKEDAETRHACGWRYLQSRGEKKCSDCQRIVADRQQSYAAQQYVAGHRGPAGATER